MWGGNLYLVPVVLAIAGAFIAGLGLALFARSRREVKIRIDE
jgi:hypothetical protein